MGGFSHSHSTLLVLFPAYIFRIRFFSHDGIPTVFAQKMIPYILRLIRGPLDFFLSGTWEVLGDG